MLANTRMLHEYIGQISDILLRESPFLNYIFDKSTTHDLPRTTYNYECDLHGLYFICDDTHHIQTIFVTKNSELAHSDRLEAHIGWSADDVIQKLGSPTKSGASWDRFHFDTHTLHAQYGQDGLVDMITLMRNDIVPGGHSPDPVH